MSPLGFKLGFPRTLPLLATCGNPKHTYSNSLIACGELLAKSFLDLPELCHMQMHIARKVLHMWQSYGKFSHSSPQDHHMRFSVVKCPTKYLANLFVCYKVEAKFPQFCSKLFTFTRGVMNYIMDRNIFPSSVPSRLGSCIISLNLESSTKHMGFVN